MSADDAPKNPLEKQVQHLQRQVDHLQKQVSILRAAGNSQPGLKLFALDGSRDFGAKVAGVLNMKLSRQYERFFPDGECYVRPRVNVRRSHVYVIQSLYSDRRQTINDKLKKLYTFIGAAVDASASEVVAVVPYLGYARSDRKVKSREPVITKYIAEHLESIGTTRILTMDVHNLGSFQNAYRTCRSDNLECKVEFASHMAKELDGVESTDISVLSPDAGGMPRARRFRGALEKRLGPGTALAFLDKEHNAERVRATQIVGEVRPVMIVVDDMIASGSTIKLAIEAAHKYGAERIYAVATHGLFVGDVNDNLNHPQLYKLVISDTIEPFRLSEQILAKTDIVPTTNLFAEAIRRTYTGESLSDLFV